MGTGQSSQSFFVKNGEGEFGPFSAKQLKELAKERRITGESFIRDGSGSWIMAGKVKGLKPFFVEQTAVATAIVDVDSDSQQYQSPPARNTGGMSDTTTCPFCAESIRATAKKCKHCGEIVDPTLREVRSINSNRHDTGSPSHRDNSGSSDKKIVPAALLCWFLGMFGAHRFYVGKNGSGVAMLLTSLTFVGIIVTAIWEIVDLIAILSGKFEDDKGSKLTEWN